MRRTFLILAAMAMLAAAPAAHAQSAEQKALGRQVAQAVFRALSLDDLITKAMQDDAGAAFADVKSRPEWGGYMVEAMKEEVQHDLPAFEALLGDSFARALTVEELRAGAALLTDPSMQAAIRAYADGGEPTVLPSPEAERLARSRAGRAFLRKLENIDEIVDPLEDEFVAELLPGAFRRFADKVEAGEKARKASASRP